VKATDVTAGLAESNGSLLPGIRRDSLHVTCGLTACTPGSAPGPMLGNEYGKTLPFYQADSMDSWQTLTDTSEHIQFLFFTFSFILLFMFGLSCFFKTDFMDSLDCYLYRTSENICFYFSFFFFSLWLHAVNKLPYVSFSAWVKTVSRMACRHIFIYFPLTVNQ